MSKQITLEKAADKAGVSPSTIYNWIKKGLLPAPTRVPNKERGRGVRAMYDEEIVESMLKIKKGLVENHSIEVVKKKIAISDDEKKGMLSKHLDALMNFVKGKKYNDEEFTKRLDKLHGIAQVSTATVHVFMKDDTQE